MKKLQVLMAAAALMTLCSCGEKKQASAGQTVRVKVMEVRTEDVNGEQGYSGTIEEISGTSLSFLSSGTIKRLYVDEGQMVRQGQIIGELDATMAQNAYTIAKTTLETAQDAWNRMKQLHDAGSLPEMQWIQTESQLKQAVAQEAIAKKQLTDTKLYAPYSGYVASKNMEVGQNAGPGLPVIKLVNISSVKVKISVPEDDVHRIQKGSSMKIIVPALENRQFEGRVTERGVTADPRSRTYEVKATILNHDNQLLPGMICQAFTNFMQDTKGVFIPSKLVQLGTDNKTFVWVVNNGKAAKRGIVVDGETAQGAKVSFGLFAGDKIIVAGMQKVSNGMDIEIVK